MQSSHSIAPSSWPPWPRFSLHGVASRVLRAAGSGVWVDRVPAEVVCGRVCLMATGVCACLRWRESCSDDQEDLASQKTGGQMPSVNRKSQKEDPAMLPGGITSCLAWCPCGRALEASGCREARVSGSGRLRSTRNCPLSWRLWRRCFLPRDLQQGGGGSGSLLPAVTPAACLLVLARWGRRQAAPPVCPVAAVAPAVSG